MLVGILVAILTVAANVDSAIDIPFDSNLIGASGFHLYVDDKLIAAKVPWLQDAGARLSSCMSGMTVPQILTIEYRPSVIGSHIVETNTLHCFHQRGADHMTCDASGIHVKAYFDTDPNRYFFANSTMSVDEIAPIVHAIVSGNLSVAEGVKVPQFEKKAGSLGTIAKQSNSIMVQYGDCGCRGAMELEPHGAARQYIVTRAGIGFCI